MTDTIRDVLIRIKMELSESKIKAPDVTKAKAAVDTLSKAAVSGQEQMGKAIDTLTKKQQKHYEKGTELHNRFTTLRTRSAEAELRREIASERRMNAIEGGLLRGAVGVATGAAHLARGVALAFVDTAESAEGLVKTIANLQSGFDMFVGTIHTIHGLAEGIESLGRLGRMAALSNHALAASNIAVGTSASAAARSMAIFKASMGPEILLIAGIAAALTALTSKTKTAGEAAEEQNRRYQKYLETFNRGRLAGLQLEEGLASRTAERSASANTQVAGLASGPGGLTGPERTRELEAIGKEINHLAALEIAAARNVTEVRSDYLENEREIEKLRKARSAETARKRDPNKLIDWDVLWDPTGRSQDKGIMRRQDSNKRLMGRESEVLERQLQLVNERVAAVKVQNAIQKTALDLQQQELKTIRDQAVEARNLLRNEESRQRAAAATLGMMTRGDRRKLSRIQTKFESGSELSRRDLEFTAGLPGGAAFNERIYAKKGDKYGGAGAFDFLQEPGALKGSDRLANLRTSFEGWTDQLAGEEALFNQVNVKTKELFESNNKALVDLIFTMTRLKDEIDSIKQNIKNNQG